MIDAQTSYVAIFGNPVGHSLSPQMHNAGFSHLGLNMAYLAFNVDNAADVAAAIRTLGFRGGSITVPHKEKITEHLDEIDETSQSIGAVNTVHAQGGKLFGSNTDWIGVVRALEQVTELRGKRCLVLGAGGAARAAIYGLQKEKAYIFLMNRSESRGRQLAAEMNCTFVNWQSWDRLKVDIVVNATTVGMSTTRDQSLVPLHWLKDTMVILDMVYLPLQTKLIKDAQQAGCVCVHGLDMLLYQGVAQFEVWTERVAPIEVMRKALMAAARAYDTP